MRRYPLAALVEASGLSEAALARSVGLSGTTLKLARENGLREDAAERYAVRAGLHPFEVWPEWIGEAEVVCGECSGRFVPTRKGHRFCSRECGKRQWDRADKRRRYRTDPSFAEAERERVRAYRAAAEQAIKVKAARYRRENRDELRAKARAYYEANRDRITAAERERYRSRREEAA